MPNHPLSEEPFPNLNLNLTLTSHLTVPMQLRVVMRLPLSHPSPFPPTVLSLARQEACERSLAEMESSHQQVMEELQRHHQREMERLRQEKERLLAEEAAATAAGGSRKQDAPPLPSTSPKCL